MRRREKVGKGGWGVRWRRAKSNKQRAEVSEQEAENREERRELV
jgi:hypothetical protein